MKPNALSIAFEVIPRALGNAVRARLGRFRSWPNDALLLDEPLALAEEKMSRLNRIYAKATREVWDGPAVFRAAMERHGGIQLAHDKRIALAHPIAMLMWGELAAWIVAAELAERLDDPDARLAASSQVFDEARHFYILRDYVAALHVPVPKLDPYFAIGVRRLLDTKDLTVKLFAMQLLAEGTALEIFKFLEEAGIEPVLSEILPYIEKDESRHVGLGVLHLPERLATMTRRQLERVRKVTYGIGDLFGATQVRYIKYYQVLGADPRDLIRRADKRLFDLGERIGPIPGTNRSFFPTNPTTTPGYEDVLDVILPRSGATPSFATKVAHGIINFGARALPV